MVAAPADKPVTGETAIVGMLRAAGRCTGRQPQESTRVSLAFLVLELTGQVADASGDWSSAATIMAGAMHGVVTGQARDAAGIAAALDAGAAESGVALDGTLRDRLAARLTSLVGQEYGRYAQGYRIEQPSPTEARLVP